MRTWLVTTTLNSNLLQAKFPPLLAALPDVRIVLVTDRIGPPMERVNYVVPSAWMRRLFGRLLSREIILWKEIRRQDVERVMVYNAVPHLLLAYYPAKFYKKKLDLHLIAGRLDLDFSNRPDVMVNRVVRKLKNPRRLENFVRRIAFTYCSRLFVPGSRAKHWLESQGVKSPRIIPIHSAVDPEKYKPDKSARDIDVLIISNLQKRKRPELTIKILEGILARRPNSNFVWIGDGHLRDEVHALINQSSVREALKMTGHTDDVLSYDKRAKVFLLNSVSEGLSCATMEAMAAGVVPVTADVGDMAEIVRTGETGILIEDHDRAESYASAICDILDDEPRRERLAKTGRELIIREHSFAAMIDAWRRLER